MQSGPASAWTGQVCDEARADFVRDGLGDAVLGVLAGANVGINRVEAVETATTEAAALEHLLLGFQVDQLEARFKLVDLTA